MLRQARIDAPGALHHIIVRGIERTTVFVDDIDRNNFLERLSRHLSESQTACYAWALMTNHAHLLLRTGSCPIASIMRRLLTGYAVSFNRRHRRHGHLFQNRYKSILCEEDAYLKQLVAYIHLNPLRDGIVGDLPALKAYPFTGHSALMGQEDRPWQDTRYVLALFGRGLSEAKRNLQRHVAKWALKGRFQGLTGGGLIRSSGGWRAVRDAYRDGIRLASDERILGSSDFVERTLREAGEDHNRRVWLLSAGINLASVIEAVCRHLGVDQNGLDGRTKRAEIVRARALIACLATSEVSIPGSEVARRLNVDRSAVSRAVQRVRRDEELMADVQVVWEHLKPVISQQ
jgi:putative transposase